MQNPVILNRQSDGNCIFLYYFPEGYEHDVQHYFIQSLGSKPNENKPKQLKGYIATLHSDGWRAVEGIVDKSREYVGIECFNDDFAMQLAFPIDPAMTAKDINGATIIEPNADNTAWTFAHATKAEHFDRIWLASTAMSSIFDRVMEDRLQQTLASIINNPQTNQQRGVYLKWADMLDFKKDCTSYCVRFEKLLYLGQHKHQRGLNLRDMLLLCIKHVKTEWQKTDGKFDGVAGDVNGIISALEADHNWETRWEQEARQKREAAARKAAEENNNE